MFVSGSENVLAFELSVDRVLVSDLLNSQSLAAVAIRQRDFVAD